jgi:DNA polymerase I-like protein with 3'-5' exonuclease and polymerase domains
MKKDLSWQVAETKNFADLHSDWDYPEEFPELRKADLLVIDTETKDPGLLKYGPGWPFRDGHMIGISVAAVYGDKTFSAYYPIAHELHGEHENMDKNKVVSWLQQELKGNNPKVFANASYDLGWLKTEGIIVNGQVEDIQIMAPLIDEHRFSYSLDSLGKTYLNETKDETLLNKAIEHYKLKYPKSEMYKLSPKFVGPYAEQDALLTLKLYHHFNKLIDCDSISGLSLRKVYDLETKLIPILFKIQERGIRVDIGKAEQVQKEFEKQIAEKQKWLNSQAGFELNINSGDDLGRACDNLGITYPRTEKTNKPSFVAYFIENHPAEFLRQVRETRQILKAKSTFIEGAVLDKVHNGRIHPQFHQLRRESEQSSAINGTISGRLSCTGPNLQQISARDEIIAPLIKQCFLPEEDHLWAAADYCFSDDTEILTDKGWKLFKDLDKTELIAQWQEGWITFDKPLEYQVFPYTGVMKSIQGKFTDLLISPNHNCLLLNRSNKPKIYKAKDYPASGKQLVAGMLLGQDYLDTSFIKLFCAIQADATIRNTTIRWYLKKDRKITRLKEILQDLSIEYIESFPPSKPGFSSISINKRDLPNFTLNYIKDYKIFTPEWRKLIPVHRRVFLKELCLWDGSSMPGKSYYCSTVKENVEIVSRVACLTDFCSVQNISFQTHQTKPLYRISLSEKKSINVDKFKKEDIYYSGNIYCVTMPEHTVIVRRKGKISITSQSQQEPRWTIHTACKVYRANAPTYWIDHLATAEKARQRLIDDPSTDYHQLVADLAQISRKEAKTINLGVAYGMGGLKLCQNLGLPTEWKKRWGKMQECAGPEGEEILRKYHEGAAYIKGLSKYCDNIAQESGYVLTVLGRHSRFNKWVSRNFDLAKGMAPVTEEQMHALMMDPTSKYYGHGMARYMTYAAMNRVIQGSSADQTKLAMVQVYEAGYLPYGSIHDELPVPVSIGNKDKEVKEIKEIMENCIPMLVPSLVKVGVGENWGGAKV